MLPFSGIDSRTVFSSMAFPILTRAVCWHHMRVLVACMTAAALLGAAERADLETISRIRQEAEQRSPGDATSSICSPTATAPASPAARTMRRPRDGRRSGWPNGACRTSGSRSGTSVMRAGPASEASGHLIAPVRDNLVFEVMAWTPSTRGAARGEGGAAGSSGFAHEEELDAWLAENAARVRGRIVLLGRPQTVPVSFSAREAAGRSGGEAETGGAHGAAASPAAQGGTGAG